MARYPSAESPDNDPLIGKTIGGRYLVLNRLGAGGMGKIYKVRHIKLDSLFALKVLYRHLIEDATVVKRFEREAKSASSIRHDNIVQISDFGEDPQVGYFFCMEYLEGENLAQRIKREGQLPVPTVCHMLMQMCDALARAHEKAVVHRDLKPENIFLIQKGWQRDVVKILDFGIAAMGVNENPDTRLTRAGTLFGTPAYISPEQAIGVDLDFRTDIYSLGVIAYEMVTGQVPFQAQTYVLLVDKHRHEPPRPPRELRPDIPPKLEQIILRCLEKKREARYQSTPEIASEIMTLTPPPVAALPYGQQHNPFQQQQQQPGYPAPGQYGSQYQMQMVPGQMAPSPAPGGMYHPTPMPQQQGYTPYPMNPSHGTMHPPPKKKGGIPWWLWVSFGILLLAAASLVVVLVAKKRAKKRTKKTVTAEKTDQPPKKTPAPVVKKQPVAPKIDPVKPVVVKPPVNVKPTPPKIDPPRVINKQPTPVVKVDQNVKLTFNTTPPGAKVKVMGVQVGVTPFTLPFRRSETTAIVVTLELTGFKPLTKSLMPSKDQMIVEVLQPTPQPTPVIVTPKVDPVVVAPKVVKKVAKKKAYKKKVAKKKKIVAKKKVHKKKVVKKKKIVAKKKKVKKVKKVKKKIEREDF